MNTFGPSTTRWAMGLCLLAALSPALPWIYLPGGQTISGYFNWHGAVVTSIGLAGALFLIATSPLSPVPWWRTLVLGILGAGIVTIVIIYSTRAWSHFPVREVGGLLAIVSSVGIEFLVALEVRQMIMRQQNARPKE